MVSVLCFRAQRHHNSTLLYGLLERQLLGPKVRKHHVYKYSTRVFRYLYFTFQIKIFHFLLLYTSAPLHFSGKYRTFLLIYVYLTAKITFHVKILHKTHMISAFLKK